MKSQFFPYGKPKLNKRAQFALLRERKKKKFGSSSCTFTEDNVSWILAIKNVFCRIYAMKKMIAEFIAAHEHVQSRSRFQKMIACAMIQPWSRCCLDLHFLSLLLMERCCSSSVVDCHPRFTPKPSLKCCALCSKGRQVGLFKHLARRFRNKLCRCFPIFFASKLR